MISAIFRLWSLQLHESNTQHHVYKNTLTKSYRNVSHKKYRIYGLHEKIVKEINTFFSKFGCSYCLCHAVLYAVVLYHDVPTFAPFQLERATESLPYSIHNI